MSAQPVREQAAPSAQASKAVSAREDPESDLAATRLQDELRAAIFERATGRAERLAKLQSNPDPSSTPSRRSVLCGMAEEPQATPQKRPRSAVAVERGCDEQTARMSKTTAPSPYVTGRRVYVRPQSAPVRGRRPQSARARGDFTAAQETAGARPQMTSRRPPLHRAPPGAAELRGFTGVDGARLRAKLNAMAKGVLARPPDRPPGSPDPGHGMVLLSP